MLKKSKKILLGFIILSFLIIIFPFLSLFKTTNQQIYQKDFLVFGTFVNVKVLSENSNQASQLFGQLDTHYEKLQKQWHSWEPGGLIFKINQAIQNKQPIKVPASLEDLIKKTQYYENKTESLFNASIGNLVDLWGFHKNQIEPIAPPSQKMIQKILKTKPSMNQIQIKNHILETLNPSIKIDVGGIAKGYIADWTIDFLKNNNIQNAIANIGGDISSIGMKGEEHWKVAIQDPNNPNQIMGIIAMRTKESIATSGSYARFYQYKNKQVSHIINPSTGQPVSHTKSVSVLSQSGIEADVMATALFVGGPERFDELVKKFKIKDAILIDQNNQSYITLSLKKRMQVNSNL